MNKWLYDIIKDNKCIGYSGDETFNTKEQAIRDAKEYIDQELTTKYGGTNNDYEITCYQAFC